MNFFKFPPTATIFSTQWCPR